MVDTSSVGAPRRRGPSGSRAMVQVSAPMACWTSGQARVWAKTARAFWMVPGVSPANSATSLPPCVAT
jgi:hypothetical protein